MVASAPRSALFAPGSPEENWLETVKHGGPAPGQGGRPRDLTPASAGPTPPRQPFESSPLPPALEDSPPKKELTSPTIAVVDTELHGWLEQIEAEKAEISAATATAAAASKELVALEAATATPQTITSTLNPLTSEIPAEYKQATPEQAAARPPAIAAEHKQTLLAALEAAAADIPQTDITALLRSLTIQTPTEHKQTTSKQEAAASCTVNCNKDPQEHL